MNKHMETVAFYSYKGGVGRTLLVANTAQFLAMSGRNVVALDLDFEAPGLHKKFGFRHPDDYDSAGGENPSIERGAVDELLDILETEPKKRKPIAYAEVNLPKDSGTLRLIPAGAAPSHRYWAALEQLNCVLRARSQTGLPEAVLELQARIDDELKPDFLLIDSRTGITELGGLATSLLADRVVCLTTTAPESVEGTKVVADALRKAPRLASQKAIELDFLITRVTGSGSSSPANRVEKELKNLGASTAVLPHDSGIANEERVYSEWFPSEDARSSHDSEDAGTKLFSATLRWIAKSFKVHEQAAEAARLRMEAVYSAWKWLTSPSERIRGWLIDRGDPWPTEQLRFREVFTCGKEARHADIAVFGPRGKLQMAIEYVDGEDREAVAEWWLTKTPAVVAAVLPGIREVDHRTVRVVSRTRRSGRYDLPLPHDFEALRDPADVSVDAMLEAVRKGYPVYLDRIVTEWVRSSAATLHGGAPWKPIVGRKIADGLAHVSDDELARKVLWAVSRCMHHRGMWLGDGDEGLEDQVLAELFAPLLWRLPADASIEILRESSHRGMPRHRPCGLFVIALLAHDILGLHYDPDAWFRAEGQRILERSGNSCEDHDKGLYSLISTFKHTEISFELSNKPPPLALTRRDSDEESAISIHGGRVARDRIASRSLVTTGLLGNYEAEKGLVTLFSESIADCAMELHLQNRHVASVTLIHETIHALMHLGRDLDGRMWREFTLPDASSPLFEPSWFHETLTQYFTYQHILRLRDPALLHAFETMSAKSMPQYRAWERIRNLPIEDARNWLMSVRRGVPPLSLQMVIHGAQDMS